MEQDRLNEDLTMQLGGAILISKYVINEMLKDGGGSLVHISSIQGVSAPNSNIMKGQITTIEYSAIKAGVISIGKWLAKYYGKRD